MGAQRGLVGKWGNSDAEQTCAGASHPQPTSSSTARPCRRAAKRDNKFSPRIRRFQSPDPQIRAWADRIRTSRRRFVEQPSTAGERTHNVSGPSRQFVRYFSRMDKTPCGGSNPLTPARESAVCVTLFPVVAVTPADGVFGSDTSPVGPSADLPSSVQAPRSPGRPRSTVCGMHAMRLLFLISGRWRAIATASEVT
jgi:hypothetical protein